MRLELYNLEHDPVISLCQIDMNPVGINYVKNFHPYNTDRVVVFNGVTYEPLPIEMSGFKAISKSLPIPKITIGNAFGTISQAIEQYDGLQGARFTRIKTMRKYLDLPADPAYIMGKQVFKVDRVSEESAISVTFELTSFLAVAGAKLPGQVMTKRRCTAQYKSAECGSVSTNPTCDRSLTNCALNFPANSPLNFNGCPGIDYVG